MCHPPLPLFHRKLNLYRNRYPICAEWFDNLILCFWMRRNRALVGWTSCYRSEDYLAEKCWLITSFYNIYRYRTVGTPTPQLIPTMLPSTKIDISSTQHSTVPAVLGMFLIIIFIITNFIRSKCFNFQHIFEFHKDFQWLFYHKQRGS